MIKKFWQNTILHELFEAVILVKGINGVWEIVIGALFFLFKTETIYNAIIWITERRIINHSEYLTGYLTWQADNFSASTKNFIAFYFLFYGLVNIFLVVALLKGKRWAYPAAIIFHSFFIVYQVYRFFVRHSGLLLVFTLLDMVMVVLTWLEYRRVSSAPEL